MASIRERLVASNLEIEERNEVIVLLERKLELTKQQLSEVDENVAVDYQRQLRKYADECKREIDKLSQQSQSVFTEKQTLIQACKALMDGMQDADQDYNAELRGAHRQGEELIDSERRKFKAGYEERLQKFLGQKAQEQKDTTSKALEPEFNRLKAMHDHEMEQVRINTQQEERKVRDLCQQRLDSALEDERRAAQEEIKLMLKSIQDRSTKDLEELSREWKSKLRQLNMEHDRELEGLRQHLKDKATRQRREHDEELHDLQDHSQQRLLELKKAHIQLLDRISHEHDQKLRDVKRSTLREEKEINAKLGIGKNKKSISYNDDVEDDDDEEEAPRPRSFAARSTPKGSPAKSKRSHAAAAAATAPIDDENENSSNDDLTADMVAQLTEVRRAAEEARDKQLQSMIRTLEAENIKLERQWQQELERDRKTISETDTKEEDSLKRRVKSLTEETADMVMEREQLLQAVTDEKKREEAVKLELTELKHELSVYRDGVNVHRSRMQEKEEQHKLALRELQLQYNPLLRDLEQELNNLNDSIKMEEKQYREESQRMEQRQTEELLRLDANVKQDVARIEEQISRVKDELEGEKAIAAKLSRLLSRYDQYDLTNKNDGQERGLSDEDNDHDEIEEELHVTQRRPPSASAVASVVSRVASRVSRTTGSNSRPTRSDKDNDGQSAYSSKSNRTISTASFSAAPVRASSANRVRASTTRK